MARVRKLLLLALVLGVEAAGSSATPTTFDRPVITTGPAPSGNLSLMTYNVHGLPWPIASGRPEALAAIGRRLRELHSRGAAPRVAVIQEAFTSEAKAIAHASGYRYVAFGPGESANTRSRLPQDGSDALGADRLWSRGEGLGKWEDSGLMILSDYPIVRVRRMAYSADACAGFDCLAAKGAMLAELVVPGGNVEIATTHMNSRHASGVSDDRSNRAWLVQASELQKFIAARRNSALPLMLSGDLNVGSDIVRQLGLADIIAAMDSRACDGLRELRASGFALGRDATFALDHAKDWELAVGGKGGRLTPRAAWVPFGSDAGAPLSDHFGYAVSYRRG